MISPHSNYSLRTLLLDTALQIALLSQDSEIFTQHIWRARCAGLIEQFRNKMQDADYDQAIINEASYAQCALLDNVALRYFPDAHRYEWEHKSLEMYFFNSNEASDIIFQRIDNLLQKANPSVERIALYDMVLGLGFCGHCTEEYDIERQRLLIRLGHCMDLNIKRSTPFKTKTLTKPLPAATISLLRTTMSGVALSLALWCALEHQLESNAKRLLESLSMMAAISSSVAREN